MLPSRSSRVVLILGLALALPGCDRPAPPRGPLATTDAAGPTIETPASPEGVVTISLAPKAADPVRVPPTTTEPTILFPEAESADHDESDPGLMQGDSYELSSSLPGPAEGARGRAGSTDAMGVGGGAPADRTVSRGGAKFFGSSARARPRPPEPRVKEGSPLSGADGFVTTDGEGKASTFAVDVDTASYATVRQALTHGLLPDPAAVRIEELVNYFEFDDPAPTDAPVAARAEVAGCPWSSATAPRRLVRVGLAAKEITERPASNLVLLVDVSGSMAQPNKLPLVKRALGLLVRQLGEQDRVALVVYAGASGLVLPSTSCADPRPILAALERLEAGGSTNGGAGLELAYRVAVDAFVTGGTNRVILVTDGDWNVGPTSQGALHDLITARAKSGVFLSVLGFGMGTSGDATMERLADEGNGHYAHVDGEKEAKKVLGREVLGTLVTVAKDVKVQVEWDAARVAAWRLVGYENRRLADADFRNDAKDAGEVGAGHGVTALYEVVLREGAGARGALGTLRWRWKQPDGDLASEASAPVEDDGRGFLAASPDLRFGAAVAAFGLLLRDGPAALGEASWGLVEGWARQSVGADPDGLRAELVALVGKARTLSEAAASPAQEASSGK